MKLENFTSGPAVLIRKLNNMVRVLRAVSNLRGDGMIQVTKSDSGYTLKLSIDQVNAQLPKGQGSGTGVRNAFALGEASVGNTISANLETAVDVDAGEEITSPITVVCEIVGATGDGDMNDAIPRIEKLDRMTVWFDGTAWRSTTMFQATVDC